MSDSELYTAEIYDKNYSTVALVLGDDIGQGYSLGINKPNPFSESTVIDFTLPSNQEVTLDFYQLTLESFEKIDCYNDVLPDIDLWNGNNVIFCKATKK